MLFYFLIFIMANIFIVVANAMVHHIVAGIKFNPEHVSKVKQWRILDFKTGESITQVSPLALM